MTSSIAIPSLATADEEGLSLIKELKEKIGKHPIAHHIEKEKACTASAFKLLVDPRFEYKIIHTPIQFNPYCSLYCKDSITNNERAENVFIIYPTFFVSGSLLIQSLALQSAGVLIKKIFQQVGFECFKASDIFEIRDLFCTDNQKYTSSLIHITRKMLSHNILMVYTV